MISMINYSTFQEMAVEKEKIFYPIWTRIFILFEQRIFFGTTIAYFIY